ncbi:hypothetical protein [Opitutus terrae]|uniref:Uncharacterized protein n=1 Tax=Opitutus terrae (strain DSM 11246 / JCM 15787 / PB90-1) TaxID=452637 RepID=B1ZSP6_OPITP|nr:hypothetical protein [Opitutus terrae]ACB74745.1 hypothetical protein Oter_1461 [Opitutus terrae PB90-1]
MGRDFPEPDPLRRRFPHGRTIAILPVAIACAATLLAGLLGWTASASKDTSSFPAREWIAPLLAALVAPVAGWAMGRLALRWPTRWSHRALLGTTVAIAIYAFASFGVQVHRSASAAKLATESCLECHAAITGFSEAHSPQRIGCASCHAGNATARDATAAHAGMILIPGNLINAPRSCGTTGCHPDILPRVERSIMTTFAGAVTADRRVFGEVVDPVAPSPHVRQLGTSAADTHLRQLCASCHLGQPKTEWGAIHQQSRGGGCNACHLRYSFDAARELDRYLATPAGDRAVPRVHPNLSIQVGNAACFGCHSRSSRIATNYEGWHELREPPTLAEVDRPPSTARFRQLDDGRWFRRMPADVHQELGLECIDCHSGVEVMGAGKTVAHKSDQLLFRCEDCHAAQLRSKPSNALDDESARVLALRRWSLPAGQRFGASRTGELLVNVSVDTAGRGRLRRKPTGEWVALKPPAAACSAGRDSHQRLSCSSCHTAWAPRCASCHTSFDPIAAGFDHLMQTDTASAWVETSGAFAAVPPTLGIRFDSRDSARPAGRVDTFIPGMILTVNRNQTAGARPDTVFRRLYAPTAAHTVRREGRSCRSCHNDPVALGYGEGQLDYVVSDTGGRWTFKPAQPAADDGLPADAWIGFLEDGATGRALRGDVRPFTANEQRRILRVGACLTCHADNSPVMQQSLADFAALLTRRSSSCVLPP